MDIGKRIQAARKSAGLTQAELAEKIGVVTGTIQQYELGKRQPRLEQLQRIADVLNTTVGGLLGYETERTIIPGRLSIVEYNDPDSKDVRYSINAADLEAHNLGIQIFEQAGISITSYTPQGRISAALDRLNLDGQQKAVERVEELTEIPKYQATKKPPQPTE